MFDLFDRFTEPKIREEKNHVKCEMIPHGGDKDAMI